MDFIKQIFQLHYKRKRLEINGSRRNPELLYIYLI